MGSKQQGNSSNAHQGNTINPQMGNEDLTFLTDLLNLIIHESEDQAIIRGNNPSRESEERELSHEEHHFPFYDHPAESVYGLQRVIQKNRRTPYRKPKGPNKKIGETGKPSP